MLEVEHWLGTLQGVSPTKQSYIVFTTHMQLSQCFSQLLFKYTLFPCGRRQVRRENGGEGGGGGGGAYWGKSKDTAPRESGM